MRVAASTRDAWLGDSTAPTAAPGPGDRLHELTLFSTNDYLGLSTHAGVKEAVCAAVARHGMGPRASSLVAGHTQAQRDLELQLAALKGHEDAVLLPCGFSANLAVAAVLAADDEVDVFSDALNHASIIDGLRLATRRSTHGRGQGVRVFVYQHSDMAHLQELLSASTAARKLVITDTLFSMDGDFAPMQALLALRQQHGFLLAVDDAHATLVCERSRRTRGVAAEAAAEKARLEAEAASGSLFRKGSVLGKMAGSFVGGGADGGADGAGGKAGGLVSKFVGRRLTTLAGRAKQNLADRSIVGGAAASATQSSSIGRRVSSVIPRRLSKMFG